jgi:hypothetical protein
MRAIVSWEDLEAGIVEYLNNVQWKGMCILWKRKIFLKS